MGATARFIFVKIRKEGSNEARMLRM